MNSDTARLTSELAREFSAVADDYDTLLALVARRVSETFGDACIIRLVSADGRVLETGNALYHPDPAVVALLQSAFASHPQRVGEGITGRVAVTGEPELIPVVDTAQLLAGLDPERRASVQKLGFTSFVVVPLLARGRSIGVMSLSRSAPERPFNEEDLRFLHEVATHAGLVIANARAYRALQESEEAHRLLFEASPLPMFAFDIETLAPIAMNAAGLRLYGYSQEEYMRLHVSDLSASGGDVVRARVESWGDRESSGKSRHRRRDGSDFLVEFATRAVLFQGRQVRMTVIKDITAEHEANEMRALLAAIVDSSNDAIVSANLDGGVSSWNAGAARLFGYSREDILGRSFDVVIPPERRDEERRLVERATRGEAIEPYEAVRRRKDGTEIAVAVSLAAIVDRDGNVIGVSRTAHDLTLRRKAERTQALLAAIVESSNDAIVSKSLDGVITSWNGAAEKLFGYPAAEAIGRSVTMLVPAERLEEERAILLRVAAGATVDHFETVRLSKGGGEVVVSISVAPVRDPSGRVVGASKTARDLTAQRHAAAALRRTEDQLRQAQKMEAVGRLAGGVAHDFNNMLSVILSYSTMVAADLKPQDPTLGDIEEIHKAASRAADLTRQLLVFSRQQVIEPKILDLNVVLSSMDRMLKRILGEDVDLVSVPGSRLGRVRADPSNVEQVIMNLVVNARDAMPTGGQLTIETRNVNLDDGYVRDHVGSSPGAHVMLSVTDTGVGMDKATQARIFEPFFTTKGPGKGTGLGLSTVFGIAQACGGSVWVYSELAKGTTFKVYFPRVEGDLDVPSLALPPVTVRGQETILLVEEPQVRAVVRGILKRNGYRVIAAENVGDAILLCEKHAGTIHLLLTDVVMPQMSGSELAKRIALARPTIKVLFMSGYTDDSIVRHGVLESGLAFLQKPFTPDSLSRKVREVLNASTAGVPTAGDGGGAPVRRPGG